jgi:hypothetical protein
MTKKKIDMKTLEEEAEEYFGADNGLYTSYSVKNKEDEFTSVVSEVRAIDFVKESKWVQAEKIKLLIEYLTEAYNKKHNILNTIIELEQQLKQLSDESR